MGLRKGAGASALAAVAALPLLTIAVIAGIGAASMVGRPFPGLFVDPYADFSSVYLMSWDLEKEGLRWPNRLVEIDHQPLARDATYPGLTADQEIARLYAQGRREVTLTFQARDGSRKEVTRKLLQHGQNEVIVFFGLYAVAALFFLWTGGVVLVLAGERAGARAYAAWAVGAYLQFITFYDYHTTCHLPVVFTLGGIWFELGLVWLAYAFPARPQRFRRTLRAVVLAATAAGTGAAAWILVAPLLHQDASTTRYVVSVGVPLSLAVPAVSFLVRLALSRGTERAELLEAVWGLIATPVALAAGYAFLVISGKGVVHLLVPLLALLPLSIGVSLARHNILNTSALLSRRLVAGPVALASGGAGLMAWLALRAMMRPDLSGWWPLALSVLLATGAFVALSRLSSRVLFQSAAKFRPTIEQLSDQLSSVHELPAIRKAIEDVVSRWLPLDRPVRVLEAHELEELSGLPADAAQRLRAGEHVWLQKGARGSPLLIPMRSLGTLRGAIHLPPRRQGALFTTEDFTLLATIASLGAVAIHQANTLSELESVRRTVVEATRDEKRQALGLVGAELSHEIAYPLNFFRFLLKRLGRGDALDPQDLEIGHEEVGRLERMLAALRRLGSVSPAMRTVRMIDPLRHAVELIREQVEEKQLKVRLEVPELLCVQADTDMLLQIFANLLRNSAQAVPSGGSIGVRASLSPEHAQVECWDDGPGVPDHLRETIWITWGHTTTQGGSGLGLAITQRLVQKLGWRIALESRGLRTSFCMYVPSRAVRDPASLDRGEVGAGGDGAGIGHLADPPPEPRALSRRS